MTLAWASYGKRKGHGMSVQFHLPSSPLKWGEVSDIMDSCHRHICVLRPWLGSSELMMSG